MSILYTYEIVNVDVPARCMEIVFSADGYETVHISGRLPFVGEMLEEVVHLYAPIRHWLDSKQEVEPPTVGTKGVMEPKDKLVSPETKPSSEIPITTLGS